MAVDYPKNENRKFPHFPPVDNNDRRENPAPDFERKKGRIEVKKITKNVM